MTFFQKPYWNRIYIVLFGIFFIVFISYYLIFGRALRQSENHFAIFISLPKLAIDSEVIVEIESNKYLARNSNAFIKHMTDRGFHYEEQIGSGYIFSMNKEKYISDSRMYSRYFRIFTHPTHD